MCTRPGQREYVATLTFLSWKSLENGEVKVITLLPRISPLKCIMHLVVPYLFDWLVGISKKMFFK